MTVSQRNKLPTTQRAYTMRLGRARGTCTACRGRTCDCWREALWETHTAVNRGAKAFGDWLLTMRGGLCHTLADVANPTTDEDRRGRRILLALSWLSVEDERGAPNRNGLRVATGKDEADTRRKAVEAALRGILKDREVEEGEIESWLKDCGPSLEGSIREDAVWVNRSRAFDGAAQRWTSLTRTDAREAVAEFFGDTSEYLSLPIAPNGGYDGAAPVGSEHDVEFRKVAREWISFNFGKGEKNDNKDIANRLTGLGSLAFDEFAGKDGTDLAAAIAERVRAEVSGDLGTTLVSIRAAIGWKTGRRSRGRGAIEDTCKKKELTRDDLDKLAKKLREEAAQKEAAGRCLLSWVGELRKCLEAAIGFRYVTGRDLIDEYSTMLDHGARRVSVAHSWIKRAEQRRREFEQDARTLDALRKRAPDGVRWLDQFCADRSTATGASTGSGYRIRKRAVGGWPKVLSAWASCKTADERIAAAREVQADPETEKPGDIQLFEALAADEAVCVWRDRDENPDASILTDYVAGTTAK